MKLKLLADQCNFGDMCDSLVRDIIIRHCRPDATFVNVCHVIRKRKEKELKRQSQWLRRMKKQAKTPRRCRDSALAVDMECGFWRTKNGCWITSRFLSNANRILYLMQHKWYYGWQVSDKHGIHMSVKGLVSLPTKFSNTGLKSFKGQLNIR